MDKRVGWEAAKPNIADTLRPCSFDALEDEFDDVIGGISQGESCGNFRLRCGNFTGTVLEQLKITEARMKFINFTDVTFRRCRFEDVVFADCGLRRALFEKCNFSGVKFTGGGMRDVKIDDCDFRFFSAEDCKLERLEIISSRLPDSYFFQCAVKSCKIENSDLSRLESERTLWRGVDFSTAKLDGMRVPVDALKGATLSMTAALALISALGISVK